MKEVLRNTLAAMAGALTAILLFYTVQAFSLRSYPWPAGLDPKDAAGVAAYMKTLPTVAFLLMLPGYFVGVAIGAHVAGRLSCDGGSRQAVMVTGLFVVASFIILVLRPYPVWFWAASLGTVVAAGWLGIRLLPKRAAA